MNYRQKWLLAAAVHVALTGYSIPGQAKTQEDLLEALDKRVRELEARLAESEKREQAALKKAAASTAAAGPADHQAVENLNRKVRTLERKYEVEKEVAAENARKLPKFEAGPSGFKISSQDDKHQVRIRGSVQADGRFFMDDSADSVGATTPSGLPDKFELKQARIWLEGKLWNSLYFKIMPDFAATNILPDAWIDYAYFPFASITAGKQKTPISLERLQGDSDGMFLERAFPTSLASNRDVGVMLHGEFAKPGYQTEYGGPVDFKNLFSYQLGVFNGSGDEGSPDKSSPDTDDDKEFVGRLWAHPFQHSGNSWLEGLGVGVAGSWEQPRRQTLQNQRTPIARSTFLNYSSVRTGFATPQADGDHYRLYPQAYWYAGPFGLMAEYAWSSQNLFSTKSGQRTDIQQNNTAWQVQASYVVTGEDNTFQSVKPFKPFNPAEGNWGALQVAARWSEFEVDDGTFEILNPAKSAQHATAWALGLNWFLNSNALVRADYEQTHFDGGAGTAANVEDRPTEKVFATRFQLAF